MQTHKESKFQKIIFRLFACPFFLLAFLTLTNFLILNKNYGITGWLMVVFLVLVCYWIIKSGEKFKFKLLIQK